MINTPRIVPIIVLCLLGGCALPPPPAAPPAPALSEIDWARAPVVLVRLTAAVFEPGVMTLQAGQPVRLVFENDGVGTHDFVTDLFGSVAMRAGTGPGTRPGGVRVILQVADHVEYDIVPQRRGIYPLESIMYEPPGAFPPAHFEVR